MLDIIIPTYNNKKGLLVTLGSIPRNPELKITVIDDCSSDDINYSDVLSYCNLLQTPYNGGPGNARQYGLSKTNEPYVIFIDTGDYFFDNVFLNILDTIKNNPQENVFSWQHISEKKYIVCSDAHNRLHGRVYKRDFLTKYNIKFCQESSFADEDIGFNRLCRIFTKFKFIELPIYMWTVDDNSITRKNKNEFIYKKQNIGLALNGIHIFNNCKGHVSPKILENECGEIMGALHNGVIKTAQERPEYLNFAWEGARLFYKTIYKPNHYFANASLYQTFSRTMKEARKKKDIWNKSIPLNIHRFLADLDKYEKIPSWYIK